MSVFKDVEEIMTDALKDLKKKGSVAPSDLETTKTVMEIIDLIDKKCERMDHEPEYEEGYSGRRMRMNGYNGYSGTYHMPLLDGPHYQYPATYDRDYSWGRYDRRYSRGSDVSDRMIHKLEEAMDEARTEEERDLVRYCIDKVMRR